MVLDNYYRPLFGQLREAFNGSTKIVDVGKHIGKCDDIWFREFGKVLVNTPSVEEIIDHVLSMGVGILCGAGGLNADRSRTCALKNTEKTPVVAADVEHYRTGQVTMKALGQLDQLAHAR